MKRPPQLNQLSRSFYERSPVAVARELLGKALLRRIGGQWVGGLIVETEAYLAQRDPASHAAKGQTASNASMFAAAGTLYVYPIHAKFCMNAVTESRGRGSAVLIRAIEPKWGLDVMKRQRGITEILRLTRGPAMLCQALQIDRGSDGIDLIRDRNLMIADVEAAASVQFSRTPRIGISQARDARLRFIIPGSPFLSRRG